MGKFDDLKSHVSGKLGKKFYRTTEDGELISQEVLRQEKIAYDCANKIVSLYQKAQSCTDEGNLKDIQYKINLLLNGAKQAAADADTDRAREAESKAIQIAEKADELIFEKLVNYYSNQINILVEEAKVCKSLDRLDEIKETIEKLRMRAEVKLEMDDSEISKQAYENAQQAYDDAKELIERRIYWTEIHFMLGDNSYYKGQRHEQTQKNRRGAAGSHNDHEDI